MAKDIEELSRGLRVKYTIADPSMWMKHGSLGESIAETFMRHGVPLIQADNDRMNGWQRLHHWLTETIDIHGVGETPMLQFYRSGCPYTIRTLPMQESDPKKPGDIKTKGVPDHAADETRYAVMSRPVPSKFRQRQVVVPGSIGWEIRKILRKQNRRRPLGSESVRLR